MAPTSADQQELRRQWAQRVAQARSAAVSAGGQVDEETMKSLDRLHRLAQWEAPAPPPRRAPLLLLALALALTASTLMFARVNSTDIELQAEAGALRLRLDATQPFSASWHLAQVAVAGADRIEGLPGAAGPGGSATHPAARGALRVDTLETAAVSSSSSNSNSTGTGTRKGTGASTGTDTDTATRTAGGSLVLQPIVLPAGAQVALQVVEDGRALRLSITAPKLVLRLSVQGPVQWVAEGGAPQRWNAAAPQALDLHAGTGQLDLVLQPRAPTATSAAAGPAHAGLQLETPLAASALGFVVVDPQSLAAGPTTPAPADTGAPPLRPRQVSTLRGGTLVFESLQGRTRTLRSGEHLLWQAGSGTVQSLRWRGAGIEWHYAATVSELTTGVGANARSLMPSWLDWMQARHGLSLLWGALLSGFGLVVAVLRWWGLRL